MVLRLYASNVDTSSKRKGNRIPVSLSTEKELKMNFSRLMYGTEKRETQVDQSPTWVVSSIAQIGMLRKSSELNI